MRVRVVGVSEKGETGPNKWRSGRNFYHGSIRSEDEILPEKNERNVIHGLSLTILAGGHPLFLNVAGNAAPKQAKRSDLQFAHIIKQRRSR